MLFSAEGEGWSEGWKVHYQSDRTGVRLTGPKPTWARHRRRRGRPPPVQHPRQRLRHRHPSTSPATCPSSSAPTVPHSAASSAPARHRPGRALETRPAQGRQPRPLPPRHPAQAQPMEREQDVFLASAYRFQPSHRFVISTGVRDFCGRSGETRISTPAPRLTSQPEPAIPPRPHRPPHPP